MEAIINRKQTAFRLSTDLLDRLKEEAKKEHRSLNNYVESILMEIIYNEPNRTTMAAIEEAKAGKYAGTIDTSSMEAFIKSCEE
ncbi:MAG: toxin-antitoxin system HicB family antitoxin [Bacteroidales bacterium]